LLVGKVPNGISERLGLFGVHAQILSDWLWLVKYIIALTSVASKTVIVDVEPCFRGAQRRGKLN
jgi:hypothetical protein